eukprot:g1760.t1
MQTANPTIEDEDPCGHIFCEPCIKLWLSQNKSCPSCRRSLTVNQLQDVPLQRRIADMKVVCQFDCQLCLEGTTIGSEMWPFFPSAPPRTSLRQIHV